MSEEIILSKRDDIRERTKTIDQYVGKRIRYRRIVLKLSQEQLADDLGLTFQQIQKYEKGANRVGAGRLKLIADILGVKVGFFYDGLEQQLSGPTGDFGFDEKGQRPYVAESDDMDNPEILKMIAAMRQITDPSVRLQIVSLLQALALQEKAENSG